MFLHNPLTGKDDPLMTLSFITGVACVVKFLLEGVSFTLYGHSFNFAPSDPMTYAALLTPVLGAHGYVHVRRDSRVSDTRGSAKIDNPDGGT